MIRMPECFAVETALTIDSVDRDGNPTSRGLSPLQRKILSDVRRQIASQNVHLDQDIERGELIEQVEASATNSGIALLPTELDEILVQIERETKKFGILQPLIDDPSVNDIIVSSYDSISIQCGRRTIKTSISFPDRDDYERYVERLLHKCGGVCNVKKPFADGVIDGHIRCHVVHQSIATSGPYLTIRIQRFSTIFGDQIVRSGLMPEIIFRYLASLIRSGKTILIAGEVGTGKTTLARALANTISTDDSILIIEDTPEITLSHTQVRYLSTRAANTEGEGIVKPADCIRAGMRMAMNRIIFGEIRDSDAAEALIDVCTSGHPGLSTVHARSALDAIKRIQLFLSRAQPGSSQEILYEQIASAIQVVVHVGVCDVTGARRTLEVRELGYSADGILKTREMLRYIPGMSVPRWKLVSRVSLFGDHLHLRVEDNSDGGYDDEISL